jgi:hypothetical protein
LHFLGSAADIALGQEEIERDKQVQVEIVETQVGSPPGICGIYNCYFNNQFVKYVGAVLSGKSQRDFRAGRRSGAAVNRGSGSDMASWSGLAARTDRRAEEEFMAFAAAVWRLV